MVLTSVKSSVARVVITALCGAMLLTACKSPLVESVKAIRDDAVSPTMAVNTDQGILAQDGTVDFGSRSYLLDTDKTLTISNSGHGALVIDASKVLIIMLGSSSVMAFTIITTSLPASIPVGGSGAETTGADFLGSMDNLRIYNRALSSAEVTALYNE